MGDACCIHGVGWRTCLARKASAAFPGADPDVAELKGNTSACGVDVVAEPQSDRKDPPSEGLSTRECELRFFSSLGYIDAVTRFAGARPVRQVANVTKDGVGALSEM